MLRLKKLSIEMQNWGSNKGRFEGTIEYEGDKGRVALTLSPEDCERFFPVVADAIVATSREVAQSLTAEAMASAPMKIA